jgi:hypothetical protein
MASWCIGRAGWVTSESGLRIESPMRLPKNFRMVDLMKTRRTSRLDDLARALCKGICQFSPASLASTSTVTARATYCHET